MTQLEQWGEPCVPAEGVSTTSTPAGTWREAAEGWGEPTDEFVPGVSPGGPDVLVSEKGPQLHASQLPGLSPTPCSTLQCLPTVASFSSVL